MAKKNDPIKTWNDVVNGVVELKEFWVDHREVMATRPDLQKLPLEAQKQLRFIAHLAPTFEKFLDAMMMRWQQTGGIEAMRIVIKKKAASKPKPKTQSKSSAMDDLLDD